MYPFTIPFVMNILYNEVYMKIIIVGIGKVGTELTSQLCLDSHNYDITVIDTNSKLIENVMNTNDVIGVCGNGASYKILEEAGIKNTDILIATTSSDEVNIVTCLVGKNLGVKNTIARVRDPEYKTQLRKMRAELGLTMMITPEQVTAREIARVLRFPNAHKLESFSKGRIEMLEYKIKDDSNLQGIALFEMYKNIKAHVIVCAVSRKGEIIIPTGDFILEAGDTIYITSSPKELQKFFKSLGVFVGKAQSVIIVGASRLCYYLCKELLAMNMSVKVIDKDRQKCKAICEQLPQVMGIVGDGTDSDLLEEEGIKHTDAYVAITGIDEANILMSMNASKLNSECKVISKVNRRVLANLVVEDGLIDSIFSTATVTGSLITQNVHAIENASQSGVKTLHRLLDGKLEAMEFHVTPQIPFVNIAIKDINLKDNILIAAIVKNDGSLCFPTGSDVLEINNDVIIVTTRNELHDLLDILE